MFDIYFHGDRKQNRIALTFDDGPSNETLKVLEILDANDAKATFFLWGERIKGREDIVLQAIKAGHEIANHTYSHKRLWFKSSSFVEEDIKRCDEELKRVGIETDIFRFPGFQFGPRSFRVCRKLGKKMIFTDMMSHDWYEPWQRKRGKRVGDINIQKPVNKALKNTKNGSILNFHDYLEAIGDHPQIIPIMEEVIPGLKKKGFEFVTVSELLINNFPS